MSPMKGIQHMQAPDKESPMVSRATTNGFSEAKVSWWLGFSRPVRGFHVVLGSCQVADAVEGLGKDVFSSVLIRSWTMQIWIRDMMCQALR